MADTLPSVFPGPPSDEDFPSWFVPSRGFCPGAFWLVTFDPRSGMHCGCPHGRKLEEEPLAIRDSCSHMRAVVQFENARNARPTGKVDAEMFVG
jgi:hypothetical protein